MGRGCVIVKSKEFTTICCGGEHTDHKCNDKDTVYEFSDGYRGSLFSKAKVEKLNLNMCDDDKLYFLRQGGIDVKSCSCACSICGRAAMDDLFYYYND